MIRAATAIVLIVVGAVWLGQGVGFIGGSFMTGSSGWAIVGAVCLVGGAWLLVGVARARRRTTRHRH